MLTDYKFSHILRNDDGKIVLAGIRVYEGEFQDVSVRDIETMNIVVQNRYVRTRRLEASELGHISNSFQKETDGSDVCILTPADFGDISTNDELALFINRRIKDDTLRTVVTEQTSI